jgi:chromosome segregation ATPase
MGKLKNLEGARKQAAEKEKAKRLGDLPTKLEELSTDIAKWSDQLPDLAPLNRDVERLKATIAAGLQASPQKMAAIMEPIRAETALLSKRIRETQEQLATLPQALAEVVAPAVTLADQLDSILEAQRRSMAEARDEQTTVLGKVQEGMELAGTRMTWSVQAAEASATKASNALNVTVTELKLALEEAREAARPKPWRTVAVVTITVAVTAVLILGGTTWLGVIDLSGQQGRESAAWREAYQQNPASQQYMDNLLSRQQ